MEGADNPQTTEDPQDTMEALLKPRPWLERFSLWKSLIKTGCAAAIGPGGGFLCSWYGRNCSFNDCPRRTFEESEFVNESVLKIKDLRSRIASLKKQIAQKNQQIKALKERG